MKKIYTCPDGSEAYLARRWLASPHWGGWRVGMVTETDEVVVTEAAGGMVTLFDPVRDEAHVCKPERVAQPNMTHPGNLAFLRIDASSAHRNPVRVEHAGWGWQWCFPHVGESWKTVHKTEAEALIAALEAAP